MRKMHAASGKSRQFNKDRFDILSFPGYVIKKNHSPGSQALSNNASNNAPQSTWYVEKGQTSKERSLRDDSGKMAQKNKSDNTTHLHRKTIPIKLHLKKGGDGRRTGTLFSTKKELKVRLDNSLFFVKQSTHIVHCTKNMLKVPAKELIPSIQHTKQVKIIDNNLNGSAEYNYTVHPRTGWTY